MEIIPRRARRSHDYHGRGIRGPILTPTLPAWRTRKQQFDDVIEQEIYEYRRRFTRELEKFDVAIIDVPHSDPSPWEDGIPLGRFIPFERPNKIHGRIIFYRRPIERVLGNSNDPALMIHAIVTEQIATALERHPEEIDYL